MEALKFIRYLPIPILFLLLALPAYTDNADCDFEPYMKNLKATVTSDWEKFFAPYEHKYKEDTTAKVLFKLNKNGHLLNSKIYRTSGYYEFDESVLKAVNKNAPYKQLPACYDKQSIDVIMTFDLYINKRKMINTLTNNTSTNTPKEYPLFETLIYNELNITPKGKILRDKDFVYFNIYEKNPLTKIEYISKCKLDCKNKTIGTVKNNILTNRIRFLADLRNVEKFNVFVKMQPIDKNNHYKLIYNYACN